MLEADTKKMISKEQRILAFVPSSAHLVLSSAAETLCWQQGHSAQSVVADCSVLWR